ncbi:MAG TPA: Gldg family protein [Pinirhizobacter sp.]|uniref:GldG family protein n=1 Tax=Pinirhizobacter sp. TaxID=2950432 RepID=UPI002C587E10|nr:Gldg family protein [Pinirhizobacter sp.]HMH68314.1 Gldg family protein [Pinirhizobacter sp.]
MKLMHLIANRRLRVWLGLIALAALFILVVLVSGRTMRTARMDLTADHLYTLTPGTLSIIDSVEQPIQLTVYFSDHATRNLPQIRSYEQRVREMLREVTARSHGRIRLRVVDPVPYSDDEDTAEGAGLNAMSGGSNGERVFFGLVGRRLADTAVNDTLSLPYFDPAREAFLEYDVAKLVYELSGRTRPVIGVMSSLPVNGNPLIGEEPWTVVRQMRQLFDVRMIDASSLKAIDPAIKVMILIHPKHLGDEALYALDQYVLRGGRLLVFVDPLAEMDNAPFVDANGVADDHQSSLPRLFAAWGVDYNADQVVLDRSQSLPIELGGLSVNHPAMMWLGAQNLSHDDVVTASLQRVAVSTAGHFELARDSDSTLLPLIQSSNEAMLAPVTRVRDAGGDPSTLLINYTPGDEHYVLAARVRGTFHTAFPERHEQGHLDHAAAPNEVLLVADTDLLSDRLWLETQNVLGPQVVQAFANNGDFVSNLVDNLSGSSALLSIRGRAGSQRPFTRVEGLRAEADQKYLTKKRELERELFETQRRVAELQPGKGGTASAEQKHELEKFLQRKLAISKELRDVQHQLNAEIDALGLRVKFVNIVLVPALVALAGLLYGWRRGRRTRRRN